MQVLYGFALIFAAAMLGLWFVQSFPSYAGKISYNDVYRMAGSFDATYNYINYAAIGVMGLTALFTLLPTLGAGTRSRALVVIPLLFTLAAIAAGGYIIYQWLDAGNGLKDIPPLALAFFGAALLELIFDFIILAKGGDVR